MNRFSLGTQARIALLVFAAVTLANCASTSGSGNTGYRPAPGSSFLVYVRPGDSVSGIAERYRVSEEDIIAINSISDPNAIISGDQLYVPAYGVGRPPVDTTPVRPAVVQRTSLAAPAPQSANRAPAARWSNAGIPAPRPAPRAPAVTPSASARFLWPVAGNVLSDFGAGANGERNDGINIRAARGTAFRAAGAGTVTYVGNELRSFGNLVLIQHDNGYVTAYAHADSISVRRGERVQEGQTIGLVGATGDVSEPQLHFEIRQGTRPVNPTAYLVNGGVNQASLTPSDPAKS